VNEQPRYVRFPFVVVVFARPQLQRDTDRLTNHEATVVSPATYELHEVNNNNSQMTTSKRFGCRVPGFVDLVSFSSLVIFLWFPVDDVRRYSMLLTMAAATTPAAGGGRGCLPAKDEAKVLTILGTCLLFVALFQASAREGCPLHHLGKSSNS